MRFEFNIFSPVIRKAYPTMVNGDSQSDISLQPALLLTPKFQQLWDLSQSPRLKSKSTLDHLIWLILWPGSNVCCKFLSWPNQPLTAANAWRYQKTFFCPKSKWKNYDMHTMMAWICIIITLKIWKVWRKSQLWLSGLSIFPRMSLVSTIPSFGVLEVYKAIKRTKRKAMQSRWLKQWGWQQPGHPSFERIV